VRLLPALLAATGSAVAQPVLTAVYTLADHHTVRWTSDRDPVRKIAGVCQIVPAAPASFTLVCAAPPVSDPRAGRRHYYGVVLFRDLEENLYVAACAAATRDTRCNDLKAGQTFPAETEDQTIRVVIDQEQLSLRILEFRPKPTSIDSPTPGTPSQVKPSPGAPSAPSWSNLPPSSGTPSQVEPSRVSIASGAPSKVSISEVSIAVGPPNSGKLNLYCAAPQARVFIDGKLAGPAPLEIPVIPGRHTVQVRAPGLADWTRVVVVPAGGLLKVTAELSP
jgi:hypothetical protein